MDFRLSPAGRFHPGLLDAGLNSSQYGAWHSSSNNIKTGVERGALSKRDVGPTASSQKLFPVLLIIGWITGCAAVVYFVFFFPWDQNFIFKKKGVRGRN